MQVAMQHLTLVALKRNEAAILARLQALEAVELTLFTEQAGAVEITDQSAQVAAALRFYKGFDTRKTRPFTNLPIVSTEEIRQEHTTAKAFVADAEVNLRRLSAIGSEQMQLDGLLAQLQVWARLPYPLEEIVPSEHVLFKLGFLPTSSFAELTNSEEWFALEKWGELKNQTAVLVAILRSESEAALAKLQEIGWLDESLPHLSGTVASNLVRLNNHRLELSSEQDQINAAAASHAQEAVDTIERYYDGLRSMLEIQQARQKLDYTEQTFCLQGWLPAERVDEVRQALTEIDEDHWLEVREPLDEEEPPVMLRNHPFIEAFEGIITLFSLPKYRETDPSIIMGISYWIFFGMMLGDTGYGLLLGILTFGLLRFYQPPDGRKSLIWLLALSSITSVAWGLLFGGYFGEPWFKPLWISPMNDPLTALILCYVLGIIHLFSAMGLKIYNLSKEGHRLDAFLDVGLWMILIIGCIMFVIPMLASVAPFAVGFAILGILCTHGRSAPTIVGKITGGLASLYGVTGYLSDILSYSRLFALGLTGGVIGMVFNIIGTMLLGIPFIGIPLGIIFLVALHAVNLVLSALSAYVHTSRLMFIEFFGKFYEGGGKACRPLAFKMQYGRAKS